MLLRMDWLPTEMNKYIVISSVIPVIPQSCRVCSNLKFVQIPGVLHFFQIPEIPWSFVFFECFCQVIARSSIVGGTVAMFRASWKLSAAVFCLRIYGQITTLHNTTSAEKRREKGVWQTLSFFWFCFFLRVRFQTFWKVWPLLVIGAVQGARASSQVGSIFTSRRCLGCLGCLGCGVVWSETSETMKTSIQTAPGDLPYEQQHWTTL